MTQAPQPCQEIPVEQMSGGVLAVQMINVHWRQVLHLLLGDTELDTPVLAAYDGAAELERGLDILLTGLAITVPPPTGAHAGIS